MERSELVLAALAPAVCGGHGAPRMGERCRRGFMLTILTDRQKKGVGT